MGIGTKLAELLRRAAAGHETEIAEEIAKMRGLRSKEDLAAYAKDKGAAARELLRERGPELKEALRQGWERLLEEAKGGTRGKGG
jgi:antitoxin (DNA-binding transcriptional repressor) of toxin-antitoxin stability system